MNTVSEHIQSLTAKFRALSKSRQNKLYNDARNFIDSNPGCADHSNFWRGLSARQVIAAVCSK